MPPGATDMEPAPNPFSRVRARRLLLWALLGGVLSLVLTAAAVRASRAGWIVLPGEAPLGLGLLVLGYGWLLAWLAFESRTAGVDVRRFFRRDRGGWGSEVPLLVFLHVLLAAGIGLTGILLLRSALPESLMPPPPGGAWLPGLGTDSPLAWVAAALMLAVVGPLVEELLFRGFLLNRWSTRWGVPAGLVLSSLSFGVLHLDPGGKFVFGLVLGALHVRTGSLRAPLAVHVLNNGLALVAVMGVRVVGPESPVDATGPVATGSVLWAGPVLLAAGLGGLLLWLRRNWPSPSAPVPYLRP